VCAAALADCFRDDGEILANPIGTLPMIGGRLAKATFGPQLVMTDGEAQLVENIMPVGVDAPEKTVGAWNPYRAMFDMVWSGRRHVIMGASQIDKHGNHNFAFIGTHAQPRTQLLGMRGAPEHGEARPHWFAHSARVFVPRCRREQCRLRRAAELTGVLHLVRVVTNLCVSTSRRRHRMRSHPGVTVDDVVGDRLRLASIDVPSTDADDGCPDPRRGRPLGLGEQEVPS
jgi:acyl CoA:acetate/3-ketoacid CoA transferase beta subunit